MFSIWSDLLNLIFPSRPGCPFCGGPVSGGDICDRCLGVIEGYRREPRCARCGRLPAEGAVFLHRGAALLCNDCRKREWPFALVRAVVPYEGVFKEAIHRFKYAGRRGLAVHFAAMMAKAVRAEPLFNAVELVLPVPLSREKLGRRGFNQALLLAKEVGALMQIPVDAPSLAKIVETPPQAGLTRAARESNLKDAFSVKNAGNIKGKSILVVDDVFTTGSTMSAAATALLRSGAGRVSGLVFAAGRCR